MIPFDHFTQPFEALNGGFLEKRCPVAMATIGKTLFAHFRQVLHASAQYDQAITVFHRLKKRLEVSNLCSLSWDQTVPFSDLAHGLCAATALQRRTWSIDQSIDRHSRYSQPFHGVTCVWLARDCSPTGPRENSCRNQLFLRPACAVQTSGMHCACVHTKCRHALRMRSHELESDARFCCKSPPPPQQHFNTAHGGRFQVNVNPFGDSK